jgi:predicted integral membrane protein DUF2269
MDFLYPVAVFLHVSSAILMIAGLIGRELTRRQARNSADIDTLIALMKASGQFESRLVIPGSMAMLVLGVIVAIMGGWPLFGFMQGADANWLFISLLLTLANFPLIAFVFLPRGKVYEAALNQAVSQGQVTGALTAAFDDSAVRAGHIIEGVLVGVVLFLMVAKPF